MGHGTWWSAEVVLPADVGSAGRARAFVTHVLVDHRLLYLVDEVRLVASELATNAIVHAGTNFTVALVEREHSVLLTVSDGSPTAPAPRDIYPAMAVSGRGLHLVNLISQAWGVGHPDGTTKSVWAQFEKRRGAAG